MASGRKVIPTPLPNLFLRGGIYYVRRQVKGHRKWISTGKRTYPAAKKRYHEIMAELDEGPRPGQPPSVREWWATAKTLGRLSLATREVDERVLGAHFVPMFGHRRLDDITRWDVRRFLTSRPVADSTRKTEFQRIHRLFQLAIKEDLLTKNPAAGIELAGGSPRQRVLTVEEQTRLLPHLSPTMRRWLIMMLGTGLRLNESRRLEPQDIKSSFLDVRHGKGGKRRAVPLWQPEVIKALEDQLAAEGRLWPFCPSELRRKLAVAAEAAGISGITPHTLRHTFATRYLQDPKGDIYILSKILGHSSVQVTEQTYAHLLVKDVAQRSAGIDLGLGGSQTGSQRKNPPDKAESA